MNKIDKKFMEFHAANPHIIDKIVKYSNKLKLAGRKKFGMGAIFERIRWDYAVSTNNDESDLGFKISNDYRSRYARMIMDKYPHLKGFYNVKQIDSTSMFAEEQQHTLFEETI